MSEADLHATVEEFLDLALPPLTARHHSPNEGKRGWAAQRAIKRQGVHKGWPDIEVFYQGQAFFIELKDGKRKLSPDQRACHLALKSAGCPVAVCRSIHEVHSFLKRYMPLRARAA